MKPDFDLIEIRRERVRQLERSIRRSKIAIAVALVALGLTLALLFTGCTSGPTKGGGGTVPPLPTARRNATPPAAVIMGPPAPSGRVPLIRIVQTLPESGDTDPAFRYPVTATSWELPTLGKAWVDYQFTNVPPGRYSIERNAEGWQATGWTNTLAADVVQLAAEHNRPALQLQDSPPIQTNRWRVRLLP